MCVSGVKIQYPSLHCQMLKHCVHMFWLDFWVCMPACLWVCVLRGSVYMKWPMMMGTVKMCILSYYTHILHVVFCVCVSNCQHMCMIIGAYMSLHPCSMGNVSRIMPLYVIIVIESVCDTLHTCAWPLPLSVCMQDLECASPSCPFTCSHVLDPACVWCCACHSLAAERERESHH